MILSNELKAEIRFLLNSGDVKRGMKELLKINLKGGLENVDDMFFINYTLSWSYNKIKDYEIAKRYINVVSDVFSDKNNIIMYETEYHKYLWLYTELYRDVIKTETYEYNFMKLYEYYKDLDSEWFSYGALWNIIKYKSDNVIYDFFINIINEIGNSPISKALLIECKKFNNEAYIKVIDKINSYDDKII